jgi:hypothetical protein
VLASLKQALSATYAVNGVLESAQLGLKSLGLLFWREDFGVLEGSYLGPLAFVGRLKVQTQLWQLPENER